MSKSSNENIKCPECGKESQFTVWSSINTDQDPEMKGAVRDMSAFRFTCPHCGASSNVNYPVLYHQMADKYMVYYVPRNEDIEAVYKMFRGEEHADMLGIMTKEGYLFRIALTQNQLREKLLIFDDGLDDRVVEVMKLFMIASLQKQHEDLKITEVLYDNDGGDKCFAILTEDGAMGSVDFEQEVYDDIKADFAEEWPEIREDEIIINTAWAYEMLRAKAAREAEEAEAAGDEVASGEEVAAGDEVASGEDEE